MIVLDTNVVSELVRERPAPQVMTWVGRRWNEGLAMSAVGEAELRYGLSAMPAGRRREDLVLAINRIIADLLRGRVLAFDRAGASHYATFVAQRRASGRLVSMADALIAATARTHGAAAIATRNLADFDGCGVPLIDPWAA